MRARLLFEMLEGHADSPVCAGFLSEEVRDALDLCLACKGCKSLLWRRGLILRGSSGTR